MKFPVYEPNLTDLERSYVDRALSSGWISSKGEFIERFETHFANYVGSRYALTTSNGTTALHVALLALGVGPGDEVVIPTLTYIATANAVAYTGATPILVDCDRATWQMDPFDIRKVIGPKTRVILPVHLYGQPCDMLEIMKIAREFNLLVVEDCAQAIGSRIGEQHVGCFGDLATFSFFGNKTITTGEGGMVVTSNPNLATKVRHLKQQGLAEFREYWHDIVGYNYRMTNICAAIGCAQLERVGTLVARKKRIAEQYRERLDALLEFQGTTLGTVHSHWMVSCLLPTEKSRDSIRRKLTEAEIETRPVFYPIHTMPMYSRGYRRTPNADFIASRGINLPSYPGLSDDDVLFICDTLKSTIKALS